MRPVPENIQKAIRKLGVQSTASGRILDVWAEARRLHTEYPDSTEEAIAAAIEDVSISRLGIGIVFRRLPSDATPVRDPNDEQAARNPE